MIVGVWVGVLVGVRVSVCVAVLVGVRVGVCVGVWVTVGVLVTVAVWVGVFWFALLTLYGLFVPNTWRRGAVVVGLIAACPLAVALVEEGRTGWPLAGRPLQYYLAVLGFWAAFGAVLAVFGSRHIEALRRQASEARRLGQYRLTKRLGAGGMGEVYLAEHVLLRRPCAVKLIRPERVSDPGSLQHFEREVQATATLTHPNTVEIYDYGRAEDGTFYYVMEYLPGMSLAEVVSRHGPLPPGRVVSLLLQVCSALGEAHAIGLIHRDVKPGNIMACIRGGVHDVAKLLDFGLVEAQGMPRMRRVTFASWLASRPIRSPTTCPSSRHASMTTDGRVPIAIGFTAAASMRTMLCSSSRLAGAISSATSAPIWLARFVTRKT